MSGIYKYLYRGVGLTLSKNLSSWQKGQTSKLAYFPVYATHKLMQQWYMVGLRSERSKSSLSALYSKSKLSIPATVSRKSLYDSRIVWVRIFHPIIRSVLIVVVLLHT